MDGGVALRAGALQAGFVIAVSLLLALALPKSFFEDWGWLSGPAAWLGCAAATAAVLSLDRRRTVLGALLAGIPSALAVVVGVHWLGVVLAVALFALWCGNGAAA